MGFKFENPKVRFLYNRCNTDCNGRSLLIKTQNVLDGMNCKFELTYLKVIDIDFCLKNIVSGYLYIDIKSFSKHRLFPN